MSMLTEYFHDEEFEAAAMRCIEETLKLNELEPELTDAEPWDFTDPADEPE